MRACGNVDELLYMALNDCFTQGQRSSPREHETLEIHSWEARLDDPRARLVKNPVRDVRKGYAAAHVAWNLALKNDVETICWWNPNGKYISDDGVTFNGANYGQRWKLYLEEAIELLRRDRATRRAWVPIWQPHDMINWDEDDDDVAVPHKDLFYSREGKDVPCTLGFGLRIVNGRLDMHVVMRSQNTMVLPYDVFLFATMLELIANTLEVGVGRLHWHAVSLHLYFRREYAMNRSSYDWYNEQRFKATSHNYEHHRLMQEPMRPLSKTLEQATKMWPLVMEQAMKSHAACKTLLDNVRLDPVEQLMVDDAVRKHTET